MYIFNVIVHWVYYRHANLGFRCYYCFDLLVRTPKLFLPAAVWRARESLCWSHPHHEIRPKLPGFPHCQPIRSQFLPPGIAPIYISWSLSWSDFHWRISWSNCLMCVVANVKLIVKWTLDKCMHHMVPDVCSVASCPSIYVFWACKSGRTFAIFFHVVTLKWVWKWTFWPGIFDIENLFRLLPLIVASFS